MVFDKLIVFSGVTNDLRSIEARHLVLLLLLVVLGLILILIVFDGRNDTIGRQILIKCARRTPSE